MINQNGTYIINTPYTTSEEYMKLPMLEGEPLKVGDKVDGYNQAGAEVVAIMNSEMIVVRSTVKGGGGYHDEAYPLLLWCVDDMKRHVHEVLDADGVPIKVGDTVYYVVEGTEYEVVGLHGGTVDVKAIGIGGDNATRWIGPKKLTHRQPDSLERIEADAMKELWHYWGCSGARCAECPALIDGETPKDHYHTATCVDAKVHDLLRRQREVLERGQE